MLTYQTLDSIADAYIPLLFFCFLFLLCQSVFFKALALVSV